MVQISLTAVEICPGNASALFQTPIAARRKGAKMEMGRGGTDGREREKGKKRKRRGGEEERRKGTIGDLSLPTKGIDGHVYICMLDHPRR